MIPFEPHQITWARETLERAGIDYQNEEGKAAKLLSASSALRFPRAIDLVDTLIEADQPADPRDIAIADIQQLVNAAWNATTEVVPERQHVLLHRLILDIDKVSSALADAKSGE